ncbi:AAA family ATPase [Synechococcus sp. M16CYN]|uniref:ATP-dependent DNA helicase n=1 Tax=Synechococcus sp. M16CYN TaxID=3103139 RepID=UPI0030DE65D3
MNGSDWPASFAFGLHAALLRRIPPQQNSRELEQLIIALTEALEQGELTILLTPEQAQLVKESGWLESEASPLLLQGNQLGWRRWLQAMDDVVHTLVERAMVPVLAPTQTKVPEPSQNLNREQRAAVMVLDQASVVLLSGGPGTGKTSIVVEILHRARLRDPGLRVGLAAPTGKAARRLGDAVRPRLEGLPCNTLHRWLEAGPHGFGRHSERPLDLDLLVIDEMSMLDLTLMQALLEAIPLRCRLVLVGDPAQLPPVRTGAVWHRLQQSDTRSRFGASAVHLTKMYRNRGAIARLANQLRDGKMTGFQRELSELSSDANVRLHCCNPLRLPTLLCDHWAEHHNVLLHLSRGLQHCAEETLSQKAEPLLKALETHLVLCPHRRGPWSLNDVHRSLLGETVLESPLHWPSCFPVICGANQPELGLANGDLGITIGSGNQGRLLFRALADDGQIHVKRFHPARLRQLEPAVALTIHRAQGSEADIVFVLWPQPLSSANRNDHDRRLLYTAITRARIRLELVSVP